MSMRIYITGPMNEQARFSVAKAFFNDLNPQLVDLEKVTSALDIAVGTYETNYYCSCSGADGVINHTPDCILKQRLSSMDGHNTIALLPGWQKDEGCKNELRKALVNEWKVLVFRKNTIANTLILD